MKPVNNAILSFWQWVEQHQHEVQRWHLLPGFIKEQWVNELHAKLKCCSDQLGILLAIHHSTHAVELTITAETNPEFFDLVNEIVQAAPQLPGWTIIALRQPTPLHALLPPGCTRVDLNALKFSILSRNGEYEGVRIFMPKLDYSRHDEFWNLLVEVLINLFGEYLFGHGLPLVELVNLPVSKTPAGLYPFLDMPRIQEAIWSNGFRVKK